MAVAARLQKPATSLDVRAVVEAVAGGWFYLAAQPDKDLTVLFITSARLVPAHRDVRLRWWLEALARTRWIRAAVKGCRIPEAVFVRNARASFAGVGGGRNWFAIGDARIAPDPLSGQGILWALDDAVTSINRLSSVSVHRLGDEVERQTLRDVDAYLLQRSIAYSSERRFGEDRFWNAMRNEANLRSPTRLSPSGLIFN
jgi:2-polyprenyl-6-methoxyphenol hydroxylase-like FAD-dependent oxidoreductase